MTKEHAKRRSRSVSSRQGRKKRKAPGFLGRLAMVGRAARQRPFLTAIVGICLLSLAAWGVVTLVTAPVVGTEVGDRAPDFRLENLDGQVVKLSDFRGKMVMLSFWGPLGDSRRGDKPGQLPYFTQAVRDEWPEDQLAILNITVGADRAEVEEFVSTYRLTFPVLIDSAQVTADYDSLHYPSHFFIDGKGIIKLVLHGDFSSQDEIAVILNKIKSNKEIETIAPIISNVSVLPIDKSALITWTTDEPATSEVIVHGLLEGEFDSCVLTQAGADLVTDHLVTLQALVPNTTYQFQVLSGYGLQNPTPSRTYSFTTLPDPFPPAISEVDVSETTHTSATISWRTDELATTEVEYWTTDRLDPITALNDELTTTHTFTLTGLKPDTDYHIELKAGDASGNKAKVDVLLTTLPPLPAAPEIGRRAPDFTLETIDGETVALSDFQGRIVMVIFWQSDCKACRSEMPHIQAVFQRWSDEELAILAVSVRESANKVRSFAESQGLTFPILLDSEGVVDELYEPSWFPTTFFVDAEGVIRQVKEERFHSPEEIETILKSL